LQIKKIGRGKKERLPGESRLLTGAGEAKQAKSQNPALVLKKTRR